MPDVDLKHVLAVALIDGGMTFEASHSYERMKDPAVLAVRERITLVGDPGLRTAKIKRGGIVEITTQDGARLREHVELVRGRPGNPMSDAEIEQKCTDLMRPVLGEERTACLIERIWNLEKVGDMREFGPCFPLRAGNRAFSKRRRLIRGYKSPDPVPTRRFYRVSTLYRHPFLLPGDFTTPQCSSGVLILREPESPPGKPSM